VVLLQMNLEKKFVPQRVKSMQLDPVAFKVAISMPTLLPTAS
jgi:hypothetical protein